MYNKVQQYYEEQAIRFENRFGVFNACAVLDGTLIKTQKPKFNVMSYYSGYKKAYELSLLLVSSIDREILFVSAGYPASVHDAAVLRSSSF